MHASTITRSRRPGLVALVLLVLLATLGVAAPTSAYIDQAPFQILMGGPGRTVRCDRSVTVTATVLDAKTGEPIRRQNVQWSFSQTQSSGDSLSATQTSTNARGQTSITVSFGPVAGSRRVRASASIVSSAVEVRCAGGLPATVAMSEAGAQPSLESLATIARVAPPAVSDAAMGLIDPGTPATRLRIDRLAMDVPIQAGDGVTVPDAAAAHFPGTAWPDAGSNTLLYAHNRDGLFAPLWQVRTGDEVTVTLADGTVATYRVSAIDPVVAWDDLDVLAPTDGEQLTLLTCLTYDPTAPRFAVIAQRVTPAA
jgi:LPXTG-site transpeptidase (sortase) family protein